MKHCWRTVSKIPQTFFSCQKTKTQFHWRRGGSLIACFCNYCYSIKYVPTLQCCPRQIVHRKKDRLLPTWYFAQAQLCLYFYTSDVSNNSQRIYGRNFEASYLFTMYVTRKTNFNNFSWKPSIFHVTISGCGVR